LDENKKTIKIKKFIQINENTLESKEYYILTIYEDGGQDYTHLFDSYKILFDYVVCQIYYELKDNSKALNDFDNQDFDGNVDMLFDYYDNLIDKYKPNYMNLNKLVYENIEVEEEVKYEDWMKVRMDSKKYNL